MSHTCAIKNCGTLIADDKLMCSHHWMRVPEHARRAVSSSWSAIRSARVAEKRKAAMTRYRDAVEQATAAVDRMKVLG